MRTIAFMNQKGGVGKTTCAVNIASCLARWRHKVLLIDMDPQANLTVHVNISADLKEKTIYSVLSGDITLAEAIREVEGEYFDFIPSTMDLSGAEVELAGMLGREQLMKKALKKLTEDGAKYDYILVDCPPSLGLLVLNALTAVNEVYIPIQAQFFALHGLSRLIEVVKLVKERLNESIEITGIIPCMFDTRTNLSREVVEELKSHFGKLVFNSVIHQNIRLAEAPSYGKTIFRYAASSTGAEDFDKLCREIRRREKRDERETPAGESAEPATTPEALIESAAALANAVRAAAMDAAKILVVPKSDENPSAESGQKSDSPDSGGTNAELERKVG